ncbi:MAG: four helix bundle protein [Christensenellales bacterium]
MRSHTKSATIVAHFVAEAQYAHSKSDFIAKLEIALKPDYWFHLLFKADLISKIIYEELLAECIAIKAILIKSCKTAKK